MHFCFVYNMFALYLCQQTCSFTASNFSFTSSKAEERAKLEGIRDKMVADMKAKGINERYYGEMLNVDINRMLLGF